MLERSSISKNGGDRELHDAVPSAGAEPTVRSSDRPGFRRDERGTSTVTTAITLPLFVVLLIGFFYLMILLVIKWQLHQGTQEAADHISDMARYWQVTGTVTMHPFLGPSEDITDEFGVLPENFYAIEAERVILSRLRDLRFYTPNLISRTLDVTVTEPALAGTTRSEPVIEEGYFERICYARADDPGEYRAPENIRFMVRSSFKVPWFIHVPFTNTVMVTLRDRSIGLVQCPRWTGRPSKVEFDKSLWMARLGPHIPFRNLATAGYPTVTVTPVPPTSTPDPSIPTPTSIP